jgi:protein-disulfide isomerase
MVTRRAFMMASSVSGFAAFLGLTSHAAVSEPVADSAAAELVAKPVSLPDMALGSAKATVTIYEYASMSCPHCAAFDETFFR